MHRILKQLSVLFVLVLAASGGSAHATTFEASASYLGPDGATSAVMRNLSEATARLDHRDNSICGPEYSFVCWASASSSGEGLGTESLNSGLGVLRTTAGFTDAWTNTTAQSQRYSFNLHLAAANLMVLTDEYRTPMEAGFAADLYVNDVSVWTTSRSLRLDSEGAHHSSAGTDISAGRYEHEFMPYAYDYAASIDLGTFASGSSFTVKYVLSTYAMSAAPTACGFECLVARAEIGDPVAFSAASAIRQVSPVPEPETYAMFLAGLGVLLAYKRRGNRHQRIHS